jgi:Pentapeptide repeats (9 copies)
MNREDTVALFLQGREAWNAWAEEMLCERKAMEAAGHWAVGEDASGKLEGKNDETRAWMGAAAADFSRCLFLVREAAGENKKETDSGAEPTVKSISIDAERIDFGGYVFPGRAGFESATFTGYTRFRRGIFKGSAYFRSATFTGAADFRAATFQDSTGFHEAEFQAEADFRGIKVDRAFNMTGAKFAKVPAFNQADFKQAPDLDDVDFPVPSRWPWRKGEKLLIPQYRAIRRMAIQGADYEREQMAFKGELRSRRWTLDKSRSPAVWLGIIYDGLANCGRSIGRPLGLWLISIIIFTGIYLWNSGIGPKGSVGQCAATRAVKWEKALTLSFSNALVVGSPRSHDINAIYLAPTTALKLSVQEEQETPHEIMRFIAKGDELVLQSKLVSRLRIAALFAAGSHGNSETKGH